MSRLIDANALAEQIRDYVFRDYTDEFWGVMQCIRDAPTIEPERKMGKWIDFVNSHCECSFCHKEWSYFENMTEWFNFCPNCGCAMEQEERR